MKSIINGNLIKELRIKKGLTQRELGERLNVSDKTVSKWELERSLPDISMIENISSALGVSAGELISGDKVENKNASANMLKSKFYVCNECNNVIFATGEGSYFCCGHALKPLEEKKVENFYDLNIEEIDNEYYISLNHPMTKDNYISFSAYLTNTRVLITKLYPEQNAEFRIPKLGRWYLYFYSKKDGLVKIRI